VCTTRLATVIVSVDDPAVTGELAGDLVHVARGRDAGADIEELPYPGLHQEPHRTLEKRPVGHRVRPRLRKLAQGLPDGLPVNRVVVLAARMLPQSAQDREQASWKTC
jgi:hypothetical protein